MTSGVGRKAVENGYDYLSTILDDFSRYIIAWRLCTTIKTAGVTATLEPAPATPEVHHPEGGRLLDLVHVVGRRVARVHQDPTSTVPFKRSFQHNRLCGPRRLLALHFRGFEDQASCSRMLGGRATPAAWKTRPT